MIISALTSKIESLCHCYRYSDIYLRSTNRIKQTIKQKRKISHQVLISIEGTKKKKKKKLQSEGGGRQKIAQIICHRRI